MAQLFFNFVSALPGVWDLGGSPVDILRPPCSPEAPCPISSVLRGCNCVFQHRKSLSSHASLRSRFEAGLEGHPCPRRLRLCGAESRAIVRFGRESTGNIMMLNIDIHDIEYIQFSSIGESNGLVRQCRI